MKPNFPLISLRIRKVLLPNSKYLRSQSSKSQSLCCFRAFAEMWRNKKNFLLNESLVLRVFLVFTLTPSSLASPVYTNDQDSCPPVPLHPALLCQVISQDVVEVSPPSCDSLLSATPLSPCHLCHNLCLLCRMLLNIFLHVPSPLLHLPLCLVLSPLPLVSLSLVSSQEAVEHFLPPGLQERGQVLLCLMCHLL